MAVGTNNLNILKFSGKAHYIKGFAVFHGNAEFGVDLTGHNKLVGVGINTGLNAEKYFNLFI